MTTRGPAHHAAAFESGAEADSMRSSISRRISVATGLYSAAAIAFRRSAVSFGTRIERLVVASDMRGCFVFTT